MKQDIDLMRKILLKIEEEFQPGQGSISNLTIGGYDLATIAEHCDLLEQRGFIKSYQASYDGDSLQGFEIGNLTAQGYRFLESIRDPGVGDIKNKRPIIIGEPARTANIDMIPRGRREDK